MSSIATAPLPLTVSKPKVHRLPASVRPKSPRRAVLPGFLLFWAAGLAVLVAVTLSIKKEPVIKEATLLPEVAVVSERLPAQPETPVASLSAISNAQAAFTPPPALSAAEPAGTIRLKDQSGVIVGQMARIPLENEPITEIKPINTVDNGGGRELLSIVGKY